jgi:hypothetical protein
MASEIKKQEGEENLINALSTLIKSNDKHTIICSMYKISLSECMKLGELSPTKPATVNRVTLYCNVEIQNDEDESRDIKLEIKSHMIAKHAVIVDKGAGTVNQFDERFVFDEADENVLISKNIVQHFFDSSSLDDDDDHDEFGHATSCPLYTFDIRLHAYYIAPSVDDFSMNVTERLIYFTPWGTTGYLVPKELKPVYIKRVSDTNCAFWDGHTVRVDYETVDTYTHGNHFLLSSKKNHLNKRFCVAP